VECDFENAMAYMLQSWDWLENYRSEDKKIVGSSED